MTIAVWLIGGALIVLLLIGWFWFCKEHPFLGLILSLLMLGSD